MTVPVWHSWVSPKWSVWAILSLMLLTFVSCADQTQTLVGDVLGRTVPPDAKPTPIADAARTDQKLTYQWDFQTQMDPRTYTNWVRERLADFDVVSIAPGSVRVAKFVGGDALRLSLTAQGGDAEATHVHVQLTVSPD